MNVKQICSYISLAVFLFAGQQVQAQDKQKPNVLMIYVDDLGYGDLSVYGGQDIETPHLDNLAKSGIRFTNAHAAASTCTPSRYALMTGNNPYRAKGTGILPGDAALIIPQDKITLPKVFHQQGYITGIVGKWHLGLGEQVEKDWNGKIAPGPLEVGYDYSFIFPATADRVPTVFLENHYVLAADAKDPIQVNYRQKIGNEPTGRENPELLKLHASPGQGHDNTIVNGIGRIGWMTGGKDARWADEELTLTFFEKAKEFIKTNQKKPFFLCYNATEPHVPRMPATLFKGKSKLGLRGDAILQLDYTVGQLVQELKSNGVYENTIIIFTSDNGPVLDDGYADQAVEKSANHDAFGGWRGGKYSAFEAGSRVPFLVSWPAVIKGEQQSDALIGQVDLLASFAGQFGISYPKDQAVDSQNQWKALTGNDKKGRAYLVKSSGTFSIIQGDYKYIKPRKGAKIDKAVNIELGNDEQPQLYNLRTDKAEKDNIANRNINKVKELEQLLQSQL
ncbi:MULTISPECIES: arylsulfatase [unclassified Sphingobacterium]|uniref:sulfatase family protein n=1 Tax=unclassified Sphingobacterium TaxID=2609468 RepID=UPI0025F21B81|nr:MULTISPECIES: arylsulfatase [unclassified Sphingobacterium]